MYIPFQPNSNLYLPSAALDKINSCFYLIGAEKPTELSLEDSWNKYTGFYIFLYQSIDYTNTEELAKLEEQLTLAEGLQEPQHTGAAWWINKETEGMLQSVIHTEVSENCIYIQRDIQIGVGGYQFPFFQNTAVLLDTDGLLYIGYPAVPDAQPSATGKSTTLVITGEQAGVLIGQVMINDFSDAIYTGWAAGFYYNMIDDTGNLYSQFYPLFESTASQYWLCDMHWDPLHPLAANRSYLSFTTISFGLQHIEGTQDQFEIVPFTGTLMPSYLRTLYGNAISLQPVATGSDPARLVFQKYANPAEPDALYLSPKGSFILNTEQIGTEPCQLLPGLAGTETISFTPGDSIIFYTDHTAFASEGLNSNTLDDTYTTSWAFIKTSAQSPDAIFSAAPAVSSLYRPSQTPGILQAYYSSSALLPKLESDALSFPIVPYAGVSTQTAHSFPPDKIPLFESQLLASLRKLRMDAMPTPVKYFDTDTPITTTTPQGLLASISGQNWLEVILAHNTEIDTALRFVDLPVLLRNAFQSDNLFLVISDNKNIGKFDHTLSIEGWQFNINIASNQDQDPKNILLLKFRPGSILDLLADQSTWTDSSSFNQNKDLSGIQTWLQEYCFDVIAHPDDPQYSNFLSIINDPEWYGILALKVDINLGNFPQELRGLLGGMDLTQFYAHHVGVQLNFIAQDSENESTSLRISKSNMFGLINYTDPSLERLAVDTTNSLDDPSYSYKVLFLQVIFANSMITDYNSQLELNAMKWFGEPASLNAPDPEASSTQNAANYAMIFDGNYENHNGHRTYTFLTKKGLSYQYFLNSNILNYTEFVKAQFQTRNNTVETETASIELVAARFTFYGYLNFKNLTNFDGFSYGASQERALESAKGLYCSNLALDIEFKLNLQDNKTSDLTITFDTAGASFDQSMSSFRDQSFAASFPISPNAIIQGSGDKTPKKLNYLPVTPPVELITTGIQGDWYALNFDLHWGGPGGLADQSGFIPQLMLAWSPSSSDTHFGIFLQLPGSSGGNSFSIQNVLKLSAGPFQLKRVLQKDNKISYNLFLINLSLSLFGLKLPPAGNINLALLGDQSQPGSLGWYGAYINIK